MLRSTYIAYLAKPVGRQRDGAAFSIEWHKAYLKCTLFLISYKINFNFFAVVSTSFKIFRSFKNL